MKNILLCLILFAANNVFCQDKNDDEKAGFDKERLFTGGSLNVSFGNSQTVLGITPQFGYSLTDWLDAGVVFNFTYSSLRDYSYGDKLRQTVYGPGAFIRVFPVNFLFASAQFEHNFLTSKYIPSGSSPYMSETYRADANSLLIGGGYAGGRQKGNNTYYFFSVSWDILGDKNSPYLDQYGRANPVIRAGYNIGLFQNNGRRRY